MMNLYLYNCIHVFCNCREFYNIDIYWGSEIYGDSLADDTSITVNQNYSLLQLTNMPLQPDLQYFTSNAFLGIARYVPVF